MKLNQIIVGIIGLIGASSGIYLMWVFCYFMVKVLGVSWWIAAGPALVFGLVGLGLVNKWILTRKAAQNAANQQRDAGDKAA